ncbi:hypothetical protein LCGC14_2736620 [marine sediment metagenome]|uniref:Uncharacterized protein n=1 Tax=marine sediment metagenome TaxID=412755 RepID=A0A0F9BEK8_9ZZZZ
MKDGDVLGITLEDVKDIDKMLGDDFNKRFPDVTQNCPYCGRCPTCGRGVDSEY